MKSILFIVITLLISSTVLFGACEQQSTPPAIYSLPELKYRLISNFDDLFYVDPDYWPIVREEQEKQNALEQFPIIKADANEFSAILDYLDMSDKTEYTNEEKLLIYRQHKKLTLGVSLTASGDIYQFILRVREGKGERIEGTISQSGKITVLKREQSYNTYPICLTKGTLIYTPDGPLPIEKLNKGMAVWTVDNSGKRIRAVVIKTAETFVSSSFQVVCVKLSDGRTITASPGHPTAEKRALCEYQVGDTLDGALVVTVEYTIYNGGATYDFLPTGLTGLYWANGILLMSTLSID